MDISMGAFFVYIVKSSACLMLFYLFYLLLLSKDTFHRFNRIALLSLILFSVAIPLCQITIREPIVMQPTVIDLETLLLMASLMKTTHTVEVPLWTQILLWTYITGALFFFGRFVYSSIRIWRIIRKAKTSRLENGIRLIVTTENIAPFSWMRYIIISEKDMEECGEEILTHETGHIQLRHSFDLLITETCILFHWFNPAVWLVRQELQIIHEYEADENVLTKGIDAKKYQLLLIKKAVGTQRFISMANSFNHSSLKKRIAMMLKRKSNPMARLKYLCVLPLAALALVAFARPEISRELEKISTVKFSELVPAKETTIAKSSEKYVTTQDTAKQTVKVITIRKDKKSDNQPTTDKDVQYAVGTVDKSILININADGFRDTSLFHFDLSKEQLAQIESLNNIKFDTAEFKGIQKMIVDMQVNGINLEELQLLSNINVDKQMIHLKDVLVDIDIQNTLNKDLIGKISDIKINVDTAMVHHFDQSFKFSSLNDDKRPLIILDGKELTYGSLDNVDPTTIESVSVIKGESAIRLYGPKGDNGVIIITTKK